ncbi:hypothetical protein NKH98_21315 [Mesorhizobium sp. M0833]|uniref:hypothetical protein n=1 Tax=Mesorhizobium sp. M0833 TaxID=2957009 RepID=UPI00333DA020
MQKFKDDELADSGAMPLGRTTYEIFAGSWPKETGDFADRFKALPKYVASTSPTPRLPPLMRSAATRRRVLIRPFLLRR